MALITSAALCSSPWPSNQFNQWTQVWSLLSLLKPTLKPHTTKRDLEEEVASISLPLFKTELSLFLWEILLWLVASLLQLHYLGCSTELALMKKLNVFTQFFQWSAMSSAFLSMIESSASCHASLLLVASKLTAELSTADSTELPQTARTILFLFWVLLLLSHSLLLGSLMSITIQQSTELVQFSFLDQLESMPSSLVQSCKITLTNSLRSNGVKSSLWTKSNGWCFLF